MTEELKQKGIKYASEYPSSHDLGYKRLGYKRVDLRKAYIAGATEKIKELQKYINYLERKVSELTLERDGLINEFLLPEKKLFDTPQHSIELKLPNEISNPFI